jgi:hypothetical protein
VPTTKYEQTSKYPRMPNADSTVVPRNHELMTPGMLRPCRRMLNPRTKTLVFNSRPVGRPGFGSHAESIAPCHAYRNELSTQPFNHLIRSKRQGHLEQFRKCESMLPALTPTWGRLPGNMADTRGCLRPPARIH